MLAFSGGGTRASALAYGVLQALRDSNIRVNQQSRRLLDEIDAISSVSGGSFTAAYFGLFGDRLFTHFEKEFLRRNVAGKLFYGLFNPALWFSRRGRTEMAINYYERTVFKGATFADLRLNNGPFIVINASDLVRGIQFSFIQEVFDLLCSDLSSFPVSRAVTASSAVPILFNPVVLKNHADCESRSSSLLAQAKKRFEGIPQLKAKVEGLSSYALKDKRRFIHLVDGGITDNLGLLALYDIVEVAGGARQFMRNVGAKPTSKLVIISVNASTKPRYVMERSNKVPSLEDTINAVSDIQLHNANAATLQTLKTSVKRWSADLSTAQQQVEPYFIEIDFDSIQQPSRRLFYNQIPVSLSLKKNQIDKLIQAGRELVLSNTEFQRLMRDLQ